MFNIFIKLAASFILHECWKYLRVFYFLFWDWSANYGAINIMIHIINHICSRRHDWSPLIMLILHSPSEKNIIRENSLTSYKSDSRYYWQTNSYPSHSRIHTNQCWQAEGQEYNYKSIPARKCAIQHWSLASRVNVNTTLAFLKAVWAFNRIVFHFLILN